MNRTVVITGASSGIGRACAEAFLELGDYVISLSRSELTLDELDPKTQERLLSRTVDLRDERRVHAVFENLETIDVLVLNAGRCEPAALDSPRSLASFRETIALNLNAPFHCLHAAIPKLSETASVVAVSSGLGKQGRAEYVAYTASKHGLLGMVRSAALELAPRGIRVNAVCPGWVDTPMAEKDVLRFAKERGRPAQLERTRIENDIPLGRFVAPEEVANLIQWLSSPQAASITGQAYNIACGEFSQ